MQPFFPPLTSLQSENLCAALYRSLSELQKNGVLSKSCVLRKDVLQNKDNAELEEILLNFSSAVLEKDFKAKAKDANLDTRVVVGGQLNPRTNDTLKTLALAYRVSISRKLERRQESEVVSDKILQELRSWHRELSQRNAVAMKIVGDLQGIDCDFSEEIREQDLLDASNVPQSWIQEILYGSEKGDGKGELLDKGYDHMKEMVTGGKALSPDEQQGNESSSLLRELDDRIGEQRRRIGRWKYFRSQLEERQGGQITHGTGVQNENKDKQHNAHGKKAQNAEQDRILPFNKHPGSEKVETKSNEEVELNCPTELSNRSEANKEQYLDSDTTCTTPHKTSTAMLDSKAAQSNFDVPEDKILDENLQYLECTSQNNAYLKEATIGNDKVTAFPPDKSCDPGKSTHLSLMERTRLSMAVHIEKPITSNTPVKSNRSPIDPETPKSQHKIYSEANTHENRRTTLMERTRESMTFLPPAPSTTIRTRKHDKSKSRQAQFPVNQFESPSKIMRNTGDTLTEGRKASRNDICYEDNNGMNTTAAAAQNAGKRNITPLEKLFSEEAEYSSIFKSRPRVVVSPKLSPIAFNDESKTVGDGTVENQLMDLEEHGEECREAYLSDELRDSPLKVEW